MTSSSITQEQLDILVARLDAQSAEITALRLRVAALERARDSDFELVSAAPSEAAASPQASPGALIVGGLRAAA